MGRKLRIATTHFEHGVECTHGKDRYGDAYSAHGWFKITPTNGAADMIGQPCELHPGHRYVEYTREVTTWSEEYQCQCGTTRGVEMRYSLGLPVDYYCDRCWASAPYRKDGAEAFDPMYAGEAYDEADAY